MNFIRTISAGLSLGAAMASPALAQDPVEIKIASFTQGSSVYVYAVTIGELLRDVLPEGSIVDTPPIGGGTTNPAIVSQGSADMGLSFAVANTWAAKGAVMYDEPVDNVRALVGGLDQYYIAIIANDDIDTQSVEEYVTTTKPDTRVMMLPTGSTGFFATTQILDVVGATEDVVTERGGSYGLGSFGVVKDSFANGSLDLFAHVVTVGHPTVTEIALSNDVTFLQPSEESLAAMTETYGWGTATLPANSFEGQTTDLSLPATNTVLIAHADMSDDLAYLITKTINENKDRLAAGHQALSDFDPTTRAWVDELNGMELHPGALRYYREQGLVD